MDDRYPRPWRVEPQPVVLRGKDRAGPCAVMDNGLFVIVASNGRFVAELTDKSLADFVISKTG